LQNLPRTNIGSHEQELYITPSIIVRFLIQLRYFKLDLIKLEKTFIRKLRRCIFDLYCHYWIACVDQTGAKVVLCFADNYFIFQRISILDKSRSYYAIQNGMRTLYCVRDRVPFPGVISMTNFFCFGEREIDMFSKQKHLIENYIPIGSLIGGYYKTQISNYRIKKRYDICFISQMSPDEYSEENKTDEFYIIYLESLHILHEYINKYLKGKKRNMVIGLRTKDEREVNIYKKVFENNCEFEFMDRENFSTYKGVDKSELTISLNSTVLADVFSWGSKVLYANLLNSEWFEIPEAGISYYCENDYEGFKNKIDELLNMDIDEYRNMTQKNAKYICNYNPDQPAHEIIRSTILKEIN
jgi:surface carbohydrate biosynthesis protein